MGLFDWLFGSKPARKDDAAMREWALQQLKTSSNTATVSLNLLEARYLHAIVESLLGDHQSGMLDEQEVRGRLAELSQKIDEHKSDSSGEDVISITFRQLEGRLLRDIIAAMKRKAVAEMGDALLSRDYSSAASALDPAKSNAVLIASLALRFDDALGA